MPTNRAMKGHSSGDAAHDQELGAHAAVPSPSEAELWRLYAVDLHRFATLLVGPDDALDCVSIAFGRVTGHIESGGQVANLRAYLMRAVANVAADQKRSAQRRQGRELRAAIAAGPRLADPPGTGLDVRRAIAGLSVQQRSVVYFTYWEELDSNEVGRLLDIAPATVRRHLLRARALLRKELQ